MGLFDILLDIQLTGIFDRITATLIGLAVLAFLFGLSRFILRTDEVEGREGAKNIMIWGVIAIFVMVSLWGFVALLRDTAGISGDNTIDFPQVSETP